MQPLRFVIVDVFAEQKYAGNQLAVFLDAGQLSTDQMQCIAREVNFSETTFVLSQEATPAGYPVRIFTPNEELPFAGHPTLGTAYVIQQMLVQQPIEQISLKLSVGTIPVSLSYEADRPGLLWMQQNPPTFGGRLSGAEVCPVLNLDDTDLDDRYPIQAVSTGLPFWIVPIKTLDALQKIRVDRDRYYALIEQSEAEGIFVFCPEVRDPAHHFSARMFADAWGIPEDPATGSANGCFAGYLVQHNYLQTDTIAVSVEQGYEMGRPSLLKLQAQRQGDSIQVRVGGQVVLVARGEFV